MSGWIKFWKDMPNDPRVLSAATKLGERYILARRSAGGGVDLSLTEICNAWRNAVTGALATLWCYADEHICDDDTLPLTSQTLDAVVGIEGFFDAMPREWIDELDDGSVILPGYCEKNSLIAKRKRTIKSNARVTRWRRAKKSNGNGVTREHVTHDNSSCNGVETKTKTKTKTKKEEEKNVLTSSTSTNMPRLREVSHGTDPEWWLDFKLAYPHRAGDPAWRRAQQAAKARIEEGHTPTEFLSGAKRYAAFCEATQKLGTEYVQQAARFLGPGKPFLEPWSVPATKADARLSSNLSAAEEFMRRTEVAQ